MLNNNSSPERHYQLWNETGLKNIKPASLRFGEFPEGWNVLEEVGRIVSPFIRRRILEIGCGYGRICRAFSPKQYIGTDINQHAIAKAKSLFHKYEFHHTAYVAPYPKADVVLAYTVFLHIPENSIHELIQNLGNHVEDIFVIEALNKNIVDHNFSKNYDQPERFHAVYNRSPEDYEKILEQHDFYLFEETIKPYYFYYPGKIYFLHFKKKPSPPSVLELPQGLNNPHLAFEGIYDDAWTSPSFTVRLENPHEEGFFFIEGSIPQLTPNQPDLILNINTASTVLLNHQSQPGEFKLKSKIPLPMGTYNLQITTHSNLHLPDPDNRRIGFLLKRIGFKS